MSKERINPIKQEKIKKRTELLNVGIDPYPHNWNKKRTNSTQMVQKFIDFSEGKTLVHIAGRLMRRRPMGKAAFFNIQDEEGELQCYIRRDDFSKNSKEDSSGVQGDVKNSQFVQTSDDKEGNSLQSSDKKTGNILSPWELWKLCDIGDIIGLSGKLFKTQKGEISLRVEDFQILCKTLETLPEKYHGMEDKELKYRYRHLDLIMDSQSRKVFKIRSRIIQEIRSFMNKQGFMEVETPILQPIYGGAVAAPFETYFRRLNQKMYLKISPEIYLKKLIVGGFEKVFEIGKNFRNEGMDRSHNPEFTMMEYYEAYTDYKDQMDQFEKLVCHVVKQVKGVLKFKYQGKELDFTPSWTRISLREFEDLLYHKLKSTDEVLFEYQEKTWAIPQFFEKLEKDIQEKRKTKKFNFKKFWEEIIFEKPDGIIADRNKASSKKDQKDKLWNHYQLILNYVKNVDSEGNFEKFDSILNQVNRPPDAKLQSLKDELVLMALELTVEKYFWQPVFIMDFPLESSPLTKKHRSKEYLQMVERFEPYVAGMEIGNAYTELNDPVDQRQRLKKQERYSENLKKSNEENTLKIIDSPEKSQSDQSSLLDRENHEDLSHPVDENFLHALEVGMPPTGGVGLGIERLVMILTDQSHIRDSILFPILRDKSK